LKKEAEQEPGRQEGNAYNANLGVQRQISARHLGKEQMDGTDEGYVERNAGGQQQKEKASAGRRRRFRLPANHCAAGAAKQPDPQGKRVDQLNAIKGDAEFPEQNGLRQDRDKSDDEEISGKQSCSLSPKCKKTITEIYRN
jgi:hypothetical protein